MPQKESRTIFEDDECVIKAGRQTDLHFFEDIMRVRAIYGDPPEPNSFDPYSTHYCLYVEAKPVGVHTATRMLDGEIDCQSFYPESLLQRFRGIAFSSCKFRILNNAKSGMRQLRRFLREVWNDQLLQGSRIDLMNADRSMVKFYRRIGYAEIPGSEFTHPTLGTDSVTMLLTADPSWPSFVQEEFAHLKDPVAMQSVLPPRKELNHSSSYSETRGHHIEQWSAYDSYKSSKPAIRQHYETVDHCHSSALQTMMASRSQLSLDIACGFGESTRLVSRFSETVVGIDSSAEMIQIAEDQDLGEKFRFVCSRFEDFDAEQQSFDLVSATWFLNHVHDEEALNQVLEKISSLVKPGGYVSLVVPSDSFTSDRTRVIASQEFDWKQGWTEERPSFTRGVFSYGENWIPTTIWQPLQLMRLLSRWFDVHSWDVKATIAREGRLTFWNNEPPFEVIHGTKRVGGLAQ